MPGFGPSAFGAEHPLAGRAGYIQFETFGRNESITHAEIVPYVEADEHTLFGDFRVFVSNDSLFGGNVGLGYRYGVPHWDRYFGASLWYDLDETTGELFQQIGLSLETYGTFWDFRSNFYLPISHDQKTYHLTVQNPQFAGNHVVYDGFRRFGEALEGLDFEFGMLLPTAAGAKHDIRLSAGWYGFFGDDVPDIYGCKVRAEGNVNDHVQMQVEMTDDRTFGTNLTLGVAILFPGGRLSDDPRSCCPAPRQAGEFVRRNYNVIVSQQNDVQTGLTAINPATGNPYAVQHVANLLEPTPTLAGGPGTVDNPFSTIAAAQAAGADLIFAHAGSVFDEALVLRAGDRILGEGVDHYIAYGSYGTHLLPTATAGTVRPTLRGIAGTGVTLASNSHLSGFVVDGATGYGIRGSGIRNATVAHVDVLDAGLDGILLKNLGGGNRFADVHVAGAAGTALYVDGGAPDVAFGGTIDNAAGRALVVENTTGGTVDLSAATVNDDGGEGVLLAQNDADVAVGRVNVRGSTTTGVAVEGGTGAVRFEQVNVEDSAGAGVSIVGSGQGVAFAELNVSTDGATGLHVRDSGTLTVDDGAIASIGASAVDIENTETDVRLTSVSSDGADVGLRLVNTPGTFAVTGSGAAGSGGTIRNANAGVVLRNVGSVAFYYLDLDANHVGIDSENAGTLGLNHVRVANSGVYGLDSLNSAKLHVFNSVFENNGGAGGHAIRAYADAFGEYEYFFKGNTFVDGSDAALAVFSTGDGDGSAVTLVFQENDVTMTGFGAAGVDFAWNGAVAGTFLDNHFAGSAHENVGIDARSSSTGDLAQFVIRRNTFAFGGEDSTGVRLTTLGPSLFSVDNNVVVFDGARGIGMDFALAPSAEAYIQQNLITDRVAGGTGIRFSSAAGSSRISIDANRIDLLGTTGIADYGIRFLSITDPITLKGTYDNVINGALTPFYAPADGVKGHIFVNGEAVP